MLRNTHPSMEDDSGFEIWMDRNLNTITFDTQSEDTVYRIPVVIHVIHNGEDIGSGNNIADAQIQSQIDVLNEDFRRLNADTVDTPTDFLPVAVDPRFEFVLAKQDPEGLPTTGILRVQGTQTSWSISDNQELKSLSYWPAEDYLNIWVAPLRSGLLGYAQFPVSTLEGLEEASNNRLTDGVVITPDAFGSREKYPEGNYDTGFDKGRTATHEIGHFLGLRHVSGDMANCTADDFCADTPTMTTDYGGLSDCTYPGGNTCDDGPGDLPDMFQNYMSLADDKCMNLYTANQTERMVVVIQNSPRRASLLTSHALNDPPPSNIDLSISTISLPLQYSCNTAFSPSILVRNLGANEITSAKVSLSLDAVFIEELTWNGNLASTDSMSLSFSAVSLAADSQTLFEFQITEVNGIVDDNQDNDQASTVTSVPPVILLPESNGFESGLADWTVRNPDDLITWQVESVPVNGNSNQALFINLYDYDLSGTINERDFFVSPLFDISADTILQLSFDVAHAKFPGRDDALLLAATNDCGNTFQDSIYFKSGSDLATVTVGGGDPFTPSSSDDWRTEIVDLSAFIGNDQLQLAFISTNAAGNNIYLDNIKLNNQLQEEISFTEGSILRPAIAECADLFAPTVLVQNTGTIGIESFQISYEISPLGIVEDSTVMTSIAVGQSANVQFDDLNLSDGEYLITYTLALPNGNPSVILPNGTTTRKFTVDTRTEEIPLRENFESGVANPWVLLDVGDSELQISKSAAPKDIANNIAAEIDMFESAELGSQHWIISPNLDLSQTNEASMFFKVSYASRGMANDRLNVYAIQDCNNPQLNPIRTLTADELAVTQSNGRWSPSDETDWLEFSIDLTAFAGSSQLKLIFEIVNDGGNTLFLDDIEVYISNDLNVPPLPIGSINLYPNPLVDGQTNIQFNLEEKETVTVTIISAEGRIVSQDRLENTLNQTHPVDLIDKRQGIYIIRVSTRSGNYFFRVFR